MSIAIFFPSLCTIQLIGPYYLFHFFLLRISLCHRFCRWRCALASNKAYIGENKVLEFPFHIGLGFANEYKTISKTTRHRIRQIILVLQRKQSIALQTQWDANLGKSKWSANHISVFFLSFFEWCVFVSSSSLCSISLSNGNWICYFLRCLNSEF